MEERIKPSTPELPSVVLGADNVLRVHETRPDYSGNEVLEFVLALSTLPILAPEKLSHPAGADQYVRWPFSSAWGEKAA